MNRPHPLVSALIACCVALLVFSCGGKGSGKSAAKAGQDSIDWNDSTFERYLILERFYNDEEHDSLLKHYPAVLEYCLAHNDIGRYFESWELVAEDYIWEGNYKKGMEETNKMMEEANARDDNYGRCIAHFLMAAAYGSQDNHEEAAKLFKQAVKEFPVGQRAPSMLTDIFSMYATEALILDDYQELEEMFRQWKDIRNHYIVDTTAQDAEGLAHIHRIYFEAYLSYYQKKGDYKKASAALDSIAYYGRVEQLSSMTRASHIGLHASLENAKKNYAKALEYAQQQLDTCNKNQLSNSAFQDAYQNLYEANEGLGRYEEALKYMKLWKDLSDSTTMSDNRHQLNELNKRFELNELTAQQERQEQEHKRFELTLMLIIALIIVVALLLFIFFRHRAAVRLEKKNEQLLIATARAEESSKMKTNFIRQISHEIRTPLNILSGFTQILTTPGMELDAATQQDINHRITENTDRITGLVNKMLELSDVDSRAVIECTDMVTVVGIADQAVENSGIRQAAHLDFDLQVDPSAESTILTTNEQAAVRALTLLLDNAMTFTKQPEGFQSDRQGQKERAALKVTLNDTQVVFAVEDSGIGVPAEEAEHIFEEFVQLNEYYEGTGVGLTVARSLVRRLGGDITLDTAYTAGARFVMTLPKSEN